MANSRVRVGQINTPDKNLQLMQDYTQRAISQVQDYEANADYWVAPFPASIDDALDRMASLLFTLHGGKIP